MIYFIGCKKENVNDQLQQSDTLTPYTLVKPYNFPDLAVPDDNKPYVQRIALGRMLYYDTRLSNDGRACGLCHIQSLGFTTTAIVLGMPVLSHTNIAWNYNFMWDGSKKGALEDIMEYEVRGFFGTDTVKINQDSTYRSMFKKYYGADIISDKDIAYALAQFIRTIVSHSTKYELFQQKLTKFTSDEYKGYTIFFSEIGDCYHCHTSYMMTDNSFHNIGLDNDYSNNANKGLYNVTGKETDIGKFRTPNLRNCALRTNFMHDGRFHTLDECIEHYNTGVKLDAENLDPIMTKPQKIYGLKLTADDKRCLIAFLNTLTDSVLITDPTLSKP